MLWSSLLHFISFPHSSSSFECLSAIMSVLIDNMLIRHDNR